MHGRRHGLESAREGLTEREHLAGSRRRRLDSLLLLAILHSALVVPHVAYVPQFVELQSGRCQRVLYAG